MKCSWLNLDKLNIVHTFMEVWLTRLFFLFVWDRLGIWAHLEVCWQSGMTQNDFGSNHLIISEALTCNSFPFPVKSYWKNLWSKRKSWWNQGETKRKSFSGLFHDIQEVRNISLLIFSLRQMTVDSAHSFTIHSLLGAVLYWWPWPDYIVKTAFKFYF